MYLSPDLLLLVVPAFLIAICTHEAAHAWMAFQFGDTTARDMGRLTLNPLRHLDPLGTIVFFVAGFGWAKPVPVDLRQLRDPLRDGVWIAAAGPGANLLLAIGSALLLRILIATGGFGLGAAMVKVGGFLQFSMTINLVLAFFNLLPLHPLDGSKVVLGLLPPALARSFLRLSAAGPMILLGLIIVGRVTGRSFIWGMLGPLVDVCERILLAGMA